MRIEHDALQEAGWGSWADWLDKAWKIIIGCPGEPDRREGVATIDDVQGPVAAKLVSI